MLAELRQRFPERLVTVELTGESEEDTSRMKAAADSIDLAVDLLPPSAPASATRAAIMALRPYGRVALMGGAGMLGGDELHLPYPFFMRNCITALCTARGCTRERPTAISCTWW